MQNNNSARASRFFATARRRHENASFHVFWKTYTSDGEIFFFLLQNLEMVVLNSTPGEFAHI